MNQKEEEKKECGCGHNHEKESRCGCGHNHETEISCGQNHEKESRCGCGHNHETEISCGHNHENESSCDCGHHHEAGSSKKQQEAADTYKQVYRLENLGCANCAAKMELKIRALPGVESATITFATKKLHMTTYSDTDICKELQSVCASIEAEVLVRNEQTETEKKGSPESKEQAKAQKKKQNMTVTEIALGAVLLMMGLIFEHGLSMEASAVRVVPYVLAYLLLGRRVVWTALKNISKGHLFDENFLMSLATLAAFAIGDFAEAVGVMLFYRVGELFEELAVEKSRSQIMEAIDLRPEVVHLLKGSDETVVPAAEALAGDVLLVRPGDRIPLDGVVIEGSSRIDTSPVTGEPVPVKVETGDAVISGCLNTSGLLQVRVEKVLGDSMVSRIMDSVEHAAASKPKIDKFITKFARVYTPFVVALALATAVIPSMITGDWKHWIYTAITFLVISCPCALVLSVPLAFFAGIGAGSKEGILLKGGVVLEALGQIRAVVMDKTGTITEGNFVVKECVTVGNIQQEQLLKMAAECERNSTHPIGHSIVAEAELQKIETERPETVTEYSGYGIRAMLPEGEVLCGNLRLMNKFGVDMTQYEAVSYGTEVLVACNGQYAGYIIIADIVKEEAKSAIHKIKSFGITTAMLTGDTEENAKAVGRETGVDEVHAKLLPEDKVTMLSSIRAKSGSVMFVGDGINDAPVLAGADVGAAMGSGADAAIEAADVVFMTSSMEAIGKSLQIARTTNRIARQNVTVALGIKALVMILGLCGFANMWMAVFADTGVAMLCVLNSVRILRTKH